MGVLLVLVCNEEIRNRWWWRLWGFNSSTIGVEPEEPSEEKEKEKEEEIREKKVGES